VPRRQQNSSRKAKIRPDLLAGYHWGPWSFAAWVGGAARRRGDSCRTPAGRARECKETASCARREKPRVRPANDLVDTAVAAGSFETLVKAVQAADLVDTLKGEGPFTVFAPTDDAFDRLPEGALDELLEDQEKLAAVLTFHGVPGRVRASALDRVAAVKTVQGQSLEVDTSMRVKIGSAYVIQPDIEISNGVLHAIDSVLLPK